MLDINGKEGAIVQDLPACGMISVRGTLTDPAFIKALETCGISMPAQRRYVKDDKTLVAWMSPDELLIQTDKGAAADLTNRLSAALSDQHVLVVDVSDMRVRFEVSGISARVCLAKLCPVDMMMFEADEVRRTRFAQIAGGVWAVDEDRFEVICFRSVEVYMRDLLTGAARHTTSVLMP